MIKTIQTILLWLAKMFSGSDEVSVKRVAFFSVIVAGIIWLSCSIHHSGITDTWVLAYQSLLSAVAISYVGGKAVEKIGGSSNVNSAETLNG